MLLGMMPNLGKAKVVATTKALVEYLEARKASVMLPLSAAQAIERPSLGFTDQEIAQDATVIMVLGGDGTLISIARRWPFWGVPLIGVNLGHLGFMTEVEEDGAQHALNMILEGEFRLQERMMLKASVHRKGVKVVESFALNDCVITKGAFSRMLKFDVFISRSFLETFPADGIIVSTPTGSTAYSLSAGGPVVDPAMQLMLLTPICAHMLQARPVVISPRDRIRIKLRATHEDIALTLDGQEGFKLYPDDEVVLERADIVTRLVKLAPRSFYDVLRRKLYETPMGEGKKNYAGTPDN